MPSEKSFENKVKDYLKSKNIWYVKFFANGFTKKGIPDLLCCVNGKFLAIEIKAEKGVVSPLQKFQLKKIADSGGYAIVLYPHSFDGFKKFIESLL